MLEMEDIYRSDGNPLRTMMIQSCLESEEDEFVLEPTVLFVQPDKQEYQQASSGSEPTSDSEPEDFGDGRFLLTFEDESIVRCSFTIASSESLPIAIFDTGCNGAHSVPSIDFLEPESIVDFPNFTVTGANGPMRPRAIGNLKGSNQRAIVLESCKVILISPSEFLNGIGGGKFVGDTTKLTVLDRKNKPRLECIIKNGHPFCSAQHFTDAVRKRPSFAAARMLSAPIGENRAEETAFKVGEYFSKEVMDRAYEARRLHKILDHPSDKDLCTALDHGCFPKCSVTSGDVKAALEIFGPCVACITGKLRLDPQRTSMSEPVRHIGEKVHIDFLPLPGPSLGSNMHILIALDEFSNYCIGIPIVSKNLVFSALKQVVGKFTRDGHTVKSFAADNEPVIRACKPDLEKIGIDLTQTPSGLHEKRVERFIQTIKGKYRSVLAGLSYVLPETLAFSCLLSVMYSSNLTPCTTTQHLTPFEVFRKIKPFVPLHSFGDLGMFYSKSDKYAQSGSRYFPWTRKQPQIP
jgi:hypothetical protein